VDVLNLTLIGWLFTLGSGFALALGSWIIITLHLSKESVRRHLISRVLDDLSAFNRWRATPPPRGILLLSLILFVFPLLAFCVAAILTLRGETALRVLVG
jgi:hypothetical protein